MPRACGSSRLPRTCGTIGSAAKGAGRRRSSLYRRTSQSAAVAADRELIVREDVARVLEAMDSLPARQREVLYLHACEELSLGEIATVLGISPDAAKASLCEARKRLRRRFREIDCEFAAVRGLPMTDPRCDQLDEYLCGWLSPDEAADFEAHLAVCPACQDEAAVQRQIDRLLAEATAQIEAGSHRLAGRIEREVRAARRRRQLAGPVR